MAKRVYISADYDALNGDRDVVDVLIRWGKDSYHKVDFIDMAGVASGSVSNNSDCRICDLKEEFNSQINASSAVIFVVGNKTADRVAGSECFRASMEQFQCNCTPYKQNANGKKSCKVSSTFTPSDTEDIGNINSFSYLKHEFMQAKKKNKTIIIVYNSLRNESNWLPSYMEDYKSFAKPFWVVDNYGRRVGNYSLLKDALGFK